MAGELALSQPNIKTSYPGTCREAGWGYCFFSHYRQVAGMSSYHCRGTWVGRGDVGCSRRTLPHGSCLRGRGIQLIPPPRVVEWASWAEDAVGRA